MSPEQFGHGLEQGHERWREIDARGKHQREMGEHRQIGAFDLQGFSLRLTEGDTVQLKEQCADGHENAEGNTAVAKNLLRIVEPMLR